MVVTDVRRIDLQDPLANGIGYGMADVLRHKTVYRATGSMQASVSPTVSHGRLGARVSVAW